MAHTPSPRHDHPVLVDTHAHLNHERFYGEAQEVLERAAEAGVATIVNVGFDLASSWRAVELADQFDNLRAVVGLHPHDAKDATVAMLDEVRQMTGLPGVVAIGEAGLDFHYDHSPRPRQKAVFADFVRMSGETGMPLVVHSREADQATLDILDEHLQGEQKVVMHCFGSDYNLARACIERGFLLGIAGPVTFPNAAALRTVVERIPLEHLMLETDCPYLAPQPRRGKRNEPAYVAMIAEEVARLKGIGVAEVAGVTTENARCFYDL